MGRSKRSDRDRSTAAKCLIATILLIAMAASSPVHGESAAIFVGDGFVVSQDDVDRLQQFYEQGVAGLSFFTSPEQHRQMALKLRLFALEAMAQGLDKGATEGLDPADAFYQEKMQLALAKHYLERLVREYPVSDRVILSFYRANPEKYEVTPFNDQVKEEIRMKVAAAKNRSIEEEAIRKLMAKYQVRQVTEGGK